MRQWRAVHAAVVSENLISTQLSPIHHFRNSMSSRSKKHPHYRGRNQNLKYWPHRCPHADRNRGPKRRPHETFGKGYIGSLFPSTRSERVRSAFLHASRYSVVGFSQKRRYAPWRGGLAVQRFEFARRIYRRRPYRQQPRLLVNTSDLRAFATSRGLRNKAHKQASNSDKSCGVFLWSAMQYERVNSRMLSCF
jgi:hypothetical protein